MAQNLPDKRNSGAGVTKYRAVAWLAWSLWALCIALLTFMWLLDFLTSPAEMREDPSVLDALFAVLALTYPTVGALVASRRQENPIGRIFLGTGVVANVFQGFALAYANYDLFVRPGSLPGQLPVTRQDRLTDATAEEREALCRW